MSEVEWLNIFGDNLAGCLKDFGLTQKDLAEMTGLSESTISNYIHKRQMPTIKAILAISYALDISVTELIDFGDKIFV